MTRQFILVFIGVCLIALGATLASGANACSGSGVTGTSAMTCTGTCTAPAVCHEEAGNGPGGAGYVHCACAPATQPACCHLVRKTSDNTFHHHGDCPSCPLGGICIRAGAGTVADPYIAACDD